MVSPFDLMFWAGIIVLILILGPSKIPSLARAVGEAVREWRRALEGEIDNQEKERKAENKDNKEK